MWKYDWISYVWSISVLLSFKQVKLSRIIHQFQAYDLKVHPTCTLIIDNKTVKRYTVEVQWHEFFADRPKLLAVNIQNQSLDSFKLFAEFSPQQLTCLLLIFQLLYAWHFLWSYCTVTKTFIATLLSISRVLVIVKRWTFYETEIVHRGNGSLRGFENLEKHFRSLSN